MEEIKQKKNAEKEEKRKKKDEEEKIKSEERAKKKAMVAPKNSVLSFLEINGLNEKSIE